MKLETITQTMTSESLTPNILIVGVGGAGNNALSTLQRSHLFPSVDFLSANTDSQDLSSSAKTILLGQKLTKGLGAGGNPNVGESAAIESISQINESMQGRDLVFVVTGLGGGTGTGAAPVIAKAAKDAGAVVVGVATLPFQFEGDRRIRNAHDGFKNFRDNVDSFILISNDKLATELGDISISQSFGYVNSILQQTILTITDLINTNSAINLDFADIKTVIENQGPALVGVGKSKGENAAIQAAINAVHSPILETSIDGSKNAIINIAGSPSNLTIQDAKEAVDVIREAAGPEIDIIFGITTDPAFEDEIVVSLIASAARESSIPSVDVQARLKEQFLPIEEGTKELNISEELLDEISAEISGELPQPTPVATPTTRKFLFFSRK